MVIPALLLAAAPFHPEPHLVEKVKDYGPSRRAVPGWPSHCVPLQLRMLRSGMLVKPIDIFDLLMHATPVLLIALKAFREIGLV